MKNHTPEEKKLIENKLEILAEKIFDLKLYYTNKQTAPGGFEFIFEKIHDDLYSILQKIKQDKDKYSFDLIKNLCEVLSNITDNLTKIIVNELDLKKVGKLNTNISKLTALIEDSKITKQKENENVQDLMEKLNEVATKMNKINDCNTLIKKFRIAIDKYSNEYKNAAFSKLNDLAGLQKFNIFYGIETAYDPIFMTLIERATFVCDQLNAQNTNQPKDIVLQQEFDLLIYAALRYEKIKNIQFEDDSDCINKIKNRFKESEEDKPFMDMYNNKQNMYNNKQKCEDYLSILCTKIDNQHIDKKISYEDYLPYTYTYARATKISTKEFLDIYIKESYGERETILENLEKSKLFPVSFTDNIKKFTIISEAKAELDKEPEVDYRNFKEHIEHVNTANKNFINHLEVHRDTLTKRSDHHLKTFLKSLCVFSATVFGFGVGGYLAYQRFFGDRATTGRRFVNELSTQDLKSTTSTTSPIRFSRS